MKTEQANILKLPEYLNDREYCMAKIQPVLEHLPWNYAELVQERAFEFGIMITKTDIHNTKYFRLNHRFIADLINKVGNGRI